MKGEAMRRWLPVVFALLVVRVLAVSPLEEAVFKEANRARLARGLQALAFDAKLYQAARAHAEDMIARGYFGHQGPGGPSPETRFWRAGVFAAKVAENLYELDGPRPGDFAARAVEAWLKSPPHRKNLLEAQFTHTAVAVVTRGERTVAVQEFAYQPFALKLRRFWEEGWVVSFSLAGKTSVPVALIVNDFLHETLAPGSVDRRDLLPLSARVRLGLSTDRGYLSLVCELGVCRWGDRVQLRYARRRVRVKGARLVFTLPAGRYLVAYGEPPKALEAVEGQGSLFAPAAWRYVWLGQGGVGVYRIPLFEPRSPEEGSTP